MLNCELRCHILDRKGQLEWLKHSRLHREEKIAQLTEAVQKAKDELEKYQAHCKKRESFISLVESTLGQHWIDRPDILEKQWLAEWENTNG